MNKSSRLCGAKLKNHYLLCMMLTSQRRPVHSVDEKQKNRLLCTMKNNVCNHLHFPRSVRTLLCSDSHANPVIVCGMLWIYFFLICTKEINAVPQFVSLSTLWDKVIRNNQIIERGLERKLYINTNASGIAGDTKPAVPSLAWECLTSSLHTFALLCKRRKPCTAPQASDKNAQT